MNNFDKDPEELQQLLQRKGNKLGWLINKANYIARLQDLVSDLLDPPLRLHVHVSNIDYGVVTMTADNASWATQLRLEIPSLIQSLKYHNDYKRVYKVIVKIKS